MARDPRRFDDLFAEFGPVDIRRMFGGEGIFVGDTMFGLVFNDAIHFKTDAAGRDVYLAEGCKPFTYEKRKTGERVSLSYYAIPDRLYDDPAELARWARAALAVAEHSPTAAAKRRGAAKRAVRGRASRDMIR